MKKTTVRTGECDGFEMIPAVVEVEETSGRSVCEADWETPSGAPQCDPGFLVKLVETAAAACGIDVPPARYRVRSGGYPMHTGTVGLAAAIGAARLAGALPPDACPSVFPWGSLDFDGRISRVRGELVGALAIRDDDRVLLTAVETARTAMLAGGQVRCARRLDEALAQLATDAPWVPPAVETRAGIHRRSLKEVAGCRTGLRAIEIAAAGGHSLLLAGPHGTGKTMLATRLVLLLGPMDDAERLETATRYSAAGFQPNDDPECRLRPLRAPHYTCSLDSLSGKHIGRIGIPGEYALAHHGVLMLDEIDEFGVALAALPHTLGARTVYSGSPLRARRRTTDFLLVGTLNTVSTTGRTGAGPLERLRPAVYNCFDMIVTLPEDERPDWRTPPRESDEAVIARVAAARALGSRRDQRERPSDPPDHTGLIAAIAGTIARLDGRVRTTAADRDEAARYAPAEVQATAQ